MSRSALYWRGKPFSQLAEYMAAADGHTGADRWLHTASVVLGLPYDQVLTMTMTQDQVDMVTAAGEDCPEMRLPVTACRGLSGQLWAFDSDPLEMELGQWTDLESVAVTAGAAAMTLTLALISAPPGEAYDPGRRLDRMEGLVRTDDGEPALDADGNRLRCARTLDDLPAVEGAAALFTFFSAAACFESASLRSTRRGATSRAATTRTRTATGTTQSVRRWPTGSGALTSLRSLLPTARSWLSTLCARRTPPTR